MEYYYAVTKNEILSFAAKWVELEDIMLSEVSQTQKDSTICSLSYVEAKNDI
jgi:hypothetical protein